MGLNIARGNMYDFVNHTWNTIKGECPHACSYCFCKRWGKQKPLHFDEKELKTDLGKGNFIFVGSSCDMWAKNIPDDWIFKTLRKCAYNPQNKYLFQTKDPERFNVFVPAAFGLFDTVFCVTIETDKKNKFMGNAPEPEERELHFSRFLYLPAMRRFVTIEPIMDFDIDVMISLVKCCKPEQVNVGADSGNNHLLEPPKEKILALIAELSKFTKVVQKPNLKRITG